MSPALPESQTLFAMCLQSTDDSEDRQSAHQELVPREEQGSEKTGLPLVECPHPLSLGRGVLGNGVFRHCVISHCVCCNQSWLHMETPCNPRANNAMVFPWQVFPL